MVTFKSECKCGKLKDYRSVMCQDCRTEATPKSTRKRPYDICSCGEKKGKGSKQCYACWRLNVLKHPERLVPCPQCTKPKDVRSVVCNECNQENAAGVKDGKKRCTDCHKWKELSEFRVRTRKTPKARSHCKECEAANRRRRDKANPDSKRLTRNWEQNNPEQHQMQKNRTRCRKACVPEKHVELVAKLLEFDIPCATCNRSARENSGTSKGRICLDHDHENNQFRGFICNHCNLAIGYLKDNPEIALKIAAYLQNPPGLQQLSTFTSVAEFDTVGPS